MKKPLNQCWGALRGPDCGHAPISIRSVQLAARVAAQSGVFTLFGASREPLRYLKSVYTLRASAKRQKA